MASNRASASSTLARCTVGSSEHREQLLLRHDEMEKTPPITLEDPAISPAPFSSPGQSGGVFGQPALAEYGRPARKKNINVTERSKWFLLSIA